jgi:hypothetical protein
MKWSPEMKTQEDEDIAKLFKALVEDEGLPRERVERALQRFQEARRQEDSDVASQTPRDKGGNNRGARGR